MRDTSKYDTQDLKTILLGKLDLGVSDNPSFWALKTTSLNAIEAPQQFAVFMPCENSDEPLDDQRLSLRTALQTFKASYKQASRYTHYKLIVPLYLRSVQRWVLLQVEPAFLESNTRVTLYDPKGFWNRRPLSYVRNVLSEVFGTRSIKKKRMGHQSNDYDDGAWVVEYAEALLKVKPVVQGEIQAIRSSHARIYNTKNKKNTWEVKHQLMQRSTFWQKHRLKILVAVTLPMGIGVLAFIGLGIRKIYRTLHLWRRRRRWRQQNERVEETFKGQEVEESPSVDEALDNQSDSADIGLVTADSGRRDETEEIVASSDSGSSSDSEGEKKLEVTQQDDRGKGEEIVEADNADGVGVLGKKLEEPQGKSDSCNAMLFWSNISGHNDAGSNKYIQLLEACLSHRSWRPASKGISLFSDSSVYKLLDEMRGMFFAIGSSDTDIIYELSEMAADALEKGHTYGEKQARFLEQMSSWQECKSVPEVRESVDAFKKLLDGADEEAINDVQAGQGELVNNSV